MPTIEFIESPWRSTGWWQQPTNILLHSTAGSLASTLATFGPGSTRKVSAHFTVDGFSSRIIQHVSLGNRAWHGMAANEFAYGIEHVDNGPWGEHPEAGYALSAWLVRYLVEQHRLEWGTRLAVNDDTLGPHSRWVATACPAALDWPRVVREAGGLMPEYVSRQEFETYQQDVRSSFESVKKAFHDHGHGKPVLPLGAIRLPSVSRRKRTAASARAGHGRGTSKDVT